MVLDPSFNTDSMATALGIQSGKHMVRRHLVEEMNALIGSARWEETTTYRDTRRDPTACRSDSLKGHFSQKSNLSKTSKTYCTKVFSSVCAAVLNSLPLHMCLTGRIPSKTMSAQARERHWPSSARTLWAGRPAPRADTLMTKARWEGGLSRWGKSYCAGIWHGWFLWTSKSKSGSVTFFSAIGLWWLFTFCFQHLVCRIWKKPKVISLNVSLCQYKTQR